MPSETWEKMIRRHGLERNKFIEACKQAEENDKAALAVRLGDLKMRDVANKVANEYGQTFEDLALKSRKEFLVKPRQACYWRLKNMGYSYARIARLFCRDHSTVIAGCKRFEVSQ